MRLRSEAVVVPRKAKANRKTQHKHESRKKLVSRATWPRESDLSPLRDPYNKWFQFGKTAYEINAGTALDHRMTSHWGQYELSPFTSRIDWRIMKRFLRVPDREWQCAKLVREGKQWNLITILGRNKLLVAESCCFLLMHNQACIIATQSSLC